MVFLLSQVPAEHEQQTKIAVCSHSFTGAGDTTVAPQSIPGDAHGAPSLQAMTWINCMVIVEDEEVWDDFCLPTYSGH